MRAVDRELPIAALTRVVDGLNVAPGATVASVLDDAGADERAVLLVFLRHYG